MSNMGIRETINNNPAATGIAGSIILVAAIIWIYVSNQDVASIRASTAYYSSDDGKTYFADDIDRIYPFDHEGKQAYRAYVYRCGDKAPHVSYLAKYSDSVRTKLEQLKGNNTPQAVEEFHDLATRIEVKKPGDTKWFSMFSREGQTLTMHPTCPDGNIATSVTP